MNHIGDTNKMVSDTPRTEAEVNRQKCWPDNLVTIDANFACQLERELNAANVEMDEKRKDVVWLATEKAKLEERIKRLEEENNELRAEEARLLNTNGELERRIKRLEEAVEAYRTAYTPDGHVAPHDCFATGPMTGNPIQDLIACPGCWAERKAKEAKL